MFSKCEDIYEAHRLAASVFGIEKPLHLKGLSGRKTESINSGVFEEDPHVVTVLPRVRTYKEKAKRSGIADRSKEKEAVRLETIRRERRNLLYRKCRYERNLYVACKRWDFTDAGVHNPV